MNTCSSFGIWLKQRRKALDLTQEELADKIGCAVITIRKLESNERRPSKLLLKRVVDELAVPGREKGYILNLARAGGELAQPMLRSSPNGAPTPLAPTSLALPWPLPRSVGYEQDVQVVKHYLTQGVVRLLTLVGPPRVGKTHLALEVAAQLQDVFCDGVVFVPLASVSESALVVNTVARALDLGQENGQPLLDHLKAALRSRKTLLILDNFEHLLSAALFVADLLVAAPRLTVLVTSRVALHISVEHEFPVTPLASPVLLPPPASDDDRLDGMGDYSTI